MPKVKSDFETFGDGLLCICEADERKLISTKIDNVRFGKKTVGISRFYQAKTAGNKVDKVICIPVEILRQCCIETGDVVILQNEVKDNQKGQYQILQIQEKMDTRPPCLYLSLEKLLHPFSDRRK